MHSPAAQPPVLKRKQQQQNKLKKKKSTPPIKIRMKDVSSGLSPVQNPLKTEANIKKRALTFCRGQRDVAIRGGKNKQITSLLPITSRTAQIPPPHPHLKCHPFPKQTKETLKHRGATSFAPFFFQPPFPNDTHFLHQFTTKPIPLDTYSVQTGFKKLVKKQNNTTLNFPSLCKRLPPEVQEPRAEPTRFAWPSAWSREPALLTRARDAGCLLPRRSFYLSKSPLSPLRWETMWGRKSSLGPPGIKYQ